MYGEPRPSPYYELELEGLDTESMSGKTIRIVVTDDIGNRIVNEYSFPKKPVPVSIKECPYSNTDYEILFADKTDEDSLIFLAKQYVDDEERDPSNHWTDYESKVTVQKKDVCNPEELYGFYDFYAVYLRNGLYGPKSDIFNPLDLPEANVAAINLATTPVTYNSPVQTGKTDITVNIKDDSWEQDDYDRIYLRYMLTNRTGDPVYIQEFERDRCSTTIQLDTDILYNSDNLYTISMRVFGEKDKIVSDGTEVTIEQFTGDEHDNMPPVIGKCTIMPGYNSTNKYFYNATIYLHEYESGVASVIAHVPGTNKTYTYSLENGLLYFEKNTSGPTHEDYIAIPDWDMDVESIDVRTYEEDTHEVRNFTYTVYDNNGNYATRTYEDNSRVIVPNIKSYTITSSEAENGWKCDFETEDLGIDYKKFYAYRYPLTYDSGLKKNIWDYEQQTYTGTGSDFTAGPTMTQNNYFGSLSKGSVYKVNGAFFLTLDIL